MFCQQEMGIQGAHHHFSSWVWLCQSSGEARRREKALHGPVAKRIGVVNIKRKAVLSNVLKVGKQSTTCPTNQPKKMKKKIIAEVVGFILVCWLVGWFVGWLVGWLFVGWFVGCLWIGMFHWNFQRLVCWTCWIDPFQQTPRGHEWTSLGPHSAGGPWDRWKMMQRRERSGKKKATSKVKRIKNYMPRVSQQICCRVQLSESAVGMLTWWNSTIFSIFHPPKSSPILRLGRRPEEVVLCQSGWRSFKVKGILWVNDTVRIQGRYANGMGSGHGKGLPTIEGPWRNPWTNRYCWWLKSYTSCNMVNFPFFARFYTSQVVQDFSHQQYHTNVLITRSSFICSQGVACEDYQCTGDGGPTTAVHSWGAKSWCCAVVGARSQDRGNEHVELILFQSRFSNPPRDHDGDDGDDDGFTEDCCWGDSTEGWSSKKKSWCCENYQKGCSTYDCYLAINKSCWFDGLFFASFCSE